MSAIARAYLTAFLALLLSIPTVSPGCIEHSITSTYAESAGDSADSTEVLSESSGNDEEPYVYRGAWVIGGEGYDPAKPPGYDDFPGQPIISIQPLYGPTTIVEGNTASIRCWGFEPEPVPTEYPIGQYIDYRFYWACEPEGMVRFSEVYSLGTSITPAEVDEDAEVTIRLYIDSPDHIVASVEHGLLIRDRTSTYDWEISWGAHGSYCAPKCDGYGNVFVFGIFGKENVDFDPGPGIEEHAAIRPEGLPPQSTDRYYSFYLSKFNREGTFQWVKVFGNGLADSRKSVIDLEIDDGGNLYLLGDFAGSVDLDPGPGEEIHGDGRDFTGTFLSVFDHAGNFGWARVWGEGDTDSFYTKCLEVDADRNIYIAGVFTGTVNLGLDGEMALARSTDRAAVCLIRLEPDGHFDWVRTWGERLSGSYEYLNYTQEMDSNAVDLESDASGNIYITGTFADTCDMNPGPGEDVRMTAGNQDVFLSSFDSSGDFRWCRTFGAEQADYVCGLEMAGGSEILLNGLFRGTVDFGDGTVGSIATAYDRSTGSGDASDSSIPTNVYRRRLGSTYMVSYSTDGEFNWLESWATPREWPGGWTEPYMPGDIVRDSTGDILVVGAFEDTADFDPGEGVYEISPAGEANLYVSRFSGSGDFESVDAWSSERDISWGCDLTADDFGGTYLTIGTFMATYMRKYSSPNAIAAEVPEEPETVEPVPTPSPEVAHVTAETSYSGGFGSDTGWVITWIEPSSLRMNTVAVDNEGYVYVGGSFATEEDNPTQTGLENCTGTGTRDNFLMKIGRDSNILWAVCWGGAGADTCDKISISDENNIIVAGGYEGEVDFDPGPGAAIGTAPSNRGVMAGYVSTFDADGNFLSVETSDSVRRDAQVPRGYTIYDPNPFGDVRGVRLVDDTGPIFLIGTFCNTTDFEPGNDTVELTPSGDRDMFIARYTDSCDLEWVKSFGGENEWTFLGAYSAVLKDDFIHVTGTIDAPVDFDPGPGEEILESYGYKRVFVCAFDTSGDYVWGFVFGDEGSQPNFSTDMAIDSTGAIYVTGNFSGKTDFCPGDEAYCVDAGRGSGTFLLKILPDGTW